MSFVFEVHFDDAFALFTQSDVSQPVRSWRHNKFVLCEAVSTSRAYRVCSDCVFRIKRVLFRPNTTIAYDHQHPSMAACFGLFLDHLNSIRPSAPQYGYMFRSFSRPSQ